MTAPMSSLSSPTRPASLHRGIARLRTPLTAVAALLLASLAAHAQNSTSLGTLTVGSTSPSPSTVTVNVTNNTATVVNKVEVVTMGAPNLDYTESGTDNCSGIGYGQSCQVSVSFSPKYPGVRQGAVVLLDSSNTILGTQYLTGIGQGSLAVMIPGSISIAAGVVGQWTQINDGHPATQADLYLPTGVAVDGTGNVFIADSHHNLIREVLATDQGSLKAGDIITVAGNGDAGPPQNAPNATSVPLNLPGAVALDGAGNLYIADTNNNVIRQVNLLSGAITTVAGDGNPGFSGDGGKATLAELNSPSGVTVDDAGNLYIADTNNNRIRKVDALTGIISTVAGNGTADFAGDGGPAIAAELNAPYGVAFDPAGNMYIPDSGNNRVRRVDPSGNISTYAGDGNAAYSGDGGAASAAELYSPLGVACDPAGNLYIADARNYVVRKVSAAGNHIISTIAGNNNNNVYGDGKSGYIYGNGQSGENYKGGGIAANAPANVKGAGIYAPYAIALDSAGNLYIAEYFDHLVREVSANSATLFFSPVLWQNQVSSTQNKVVENDGTAALSLASATPDANTKVISNGCSSSIAIDAQCSVGVQLAPANAGNPLVGTITLTGNPANSPLSIAAVGQALGLNGAEVTLSSTPNPSSYGQPVNLSVTVAQGPGSTKGTPTGTVTFYDTSNGTKTPLGTAQTLNAAGNATLQLTSFAVGTHTITASYSGDTYYSPANSNPVTQNVQEQVTVTVTSTSPNDTSVLGSAVSFSAGVTISGGVPVTGAVSFYDGANFIGSGNLNGSGVASFVTAALPLGTNSITATYTDMNNVSATSPAVIQTVEQQTGTSVASSANPSIYGRAVTFVATVVASGTVVPTGSVTFYDGATQLGKGALATSGTATASATFTTSSLTAGTHTITAAYGGDPDDLTSTSGALTQTVNITSTSTGLTANVSTLVAGQALTLTAVVTANGGTPTGVVNFYSGSALLGAGKLNGAGVATYSTSALNVGSYSLTASYEGDPNNTGSSSSALAISVIQATTSVQLAASRISAPVGSPISFTASVKGNGGIPSGTVTFMDGANTLGSVALTRGVATYTTSSLAVGQHSIKAIYAGDPDDSGSASPPVTATVTAFATQTMLAASATRLNTDQQLTLLTTTTSTSGGTPTGTLTFMNGTTSLGTAAVGAAGSGTLTLSLQQGTYNITAQYGGNSIFAPSTSNPISITVAQATEFTIQLNPTSVSIPTSKYANISIALSSENGFADKVALGCGSLPYSVTCSFANNDVALNANGTATVQLTVDTNSPLASGGQARNEMPGGNNRMLAACLFPGSALFGFVFWRFRRRTAALRVLAIITMLAGTTFLMTGCGGFSLNSAKPGSYVIQVTATGEQTGVTHVANLTVQVTQ